MSYIFQFIATYWTAIVVIEIVFVAFIVWGMFHQKQLVQFEDKCIAFVIRLFLRKSHDAKITLYKAARKVFLFFYVPYRRMKKKVLKRLLAQFGLRAVKDSSKQVTGNEILSR